MIEDMMNRSDYNEGERLLRRSEAAKYIVDKYNVPCSAKTLAKLACVSSEGPPFRRAGRFPLYPVSGLDAFEKGASPFIFRQLGLTVHIGYVGDPVKPQALRLEWPGIRDWAGAGPGFQSPGAGHPHWQVDVLESLAEQNTQTESFELEPSSVVEEFGAEVIAIPIDKLLLSLTFESMHLASAARWWIAATAGQSKQHINAPSDLASLTRWLTEGVLYIQQELGRCSFR